MISILVPLEQEIDIKICMPDGSEADVKGHIEFNKNSNQFLIFPKKIIVTKSQESKP
jgi:hypothetical protein